MKTDVRDTTEEKKVNKLLMTTVDIEAKWRKENQEVIRKNKGIAKFCKEKEK